MPFVVVSVRTL